MARCSFCGKEFESNKEVGDHIEREHRDEAEQEMSSDIKKRNLVVKYTLTAVIVVAASLVIPQVLNEAPAALDDTRSAINLSENPVLGEKDANITIIMFGDYKCTTCADVNSILTEDIYDDYIENGTAKMYFLNYDYLGVKGGGSSTRAAVAGECVFKQDKEQFWPFHSTIYSNQGLITEDWATEDYLVDLAKESTSGLNYSDLRECISSEKTLDKVNRDKTAGIKLNVGQTPALFINGEELSNPSAENIRERIDQAKGRNESERNN